MRGNTYSKKQSSEQISRKLSEFIKEIQYKNRNPVDNNVLKMLQEMETNPELLFDSQQYLYRSRIVHSKDKLNGEYPFFGFGKDGSFVAPSECTKDMRANYRYIPYRAFTKAVSNMAIMDITDIEPLFMAVYELLEENGIFVFATQHPCFITLTEKYMTPHSYYDIAIEGQPEEQIYYHRSIQDIFNLCFRAGFVIDGFYEECFKNNKEICRDLWINF